MCVCVSRCQRRPTPATSNNNKKRRQKQQQLRSKTTKRQERRQQRRPQLRQATKQRRRNPPQQHDNNSIDRWYIDRRKKTRKKDDNNMFGESQHNKISTHNTTTPTPTYRPSRPPLIHFEMCLRRPPPLIGVVADWVTDDVSDWETTNQRWCLQNVGAGTL